ncbi:hypothetical protein [Schaalia hyovaginalis]|uniref:hypothetical protein n=1 Tax=Schaalia hyovaginalis TaxID=29316 RepID=UPI002A756511|nr:hypothetical protein [Schaalia hyovaginalis]MDY2669798.1 hypothetical protein [Schaalia hyovaginalis]
MDLYEVLDGVEIDIDGVRMAVSIQALRILPAVPKMLKDGYGCWYDDGSTREWIEHDSSVTMSIYGDTPYPKIPRLPGSLYDEIHEFLTYCGKREITPVIKMDSGVITLEEEHESL